MKSIVFLVLSLCSWASTLPAAAPVQPKAFSGLWYEIARTYNDYEKNCVAATVEYTLKQDDSYDVTNRCFDKKIGADLIVYNGTGKTLIPNSASKLKLTYFWVFSREYHIVHWDESYAVMASPDLNQLWIMSRTPQIPKNKLDGILTKLSSVMDTKKLIFTPQDPKGRYQ
jgi:apolipoprotein D and lipocalin family protein